MNAAGLAAFLRELRVRCPELVILENEPMAKHCSFRIGGRCDAMLLPSTKLTYVEACQTISSTDADSLFYSLNELLLPVDSSALSELKSRYLPNMTTIYGGKVWLTSVDELQGIQDALHNSAKEALSLIDSTGGDEQRRTDAMHIRNDKIAQLIESYEVIRLALIVDAVLLMVH